jgi:hypothetical protein
MHGGIVTETTTKILDNLGTLLPAYWNGVAGHAPGVLIRAIADQANWQNAPDRGPPAAVERHLGFGSAFCVLRSAFCVLRSAFCVLRARRGAEE